MSKYQPLEIYLSQSREEIVNVTFRKIEEVVGHELPPSARKYRYWWSNNPNNGIITKYWLSAGYKSKNVNMECETLDFVKNRESSLKEAPSVVGQSETSINDSAISISMTDEKILAKLRCTVTIMPGTDLTAPTGQNSNVE